MMLSGRLDKNRMKAFTMIELMIVMSLMAILGVIGVMNLVNYRERQNIKVTSQGIMTVLRNAQNRSISQETTSTQGTGTRWGIHFENPATGLDFYDLFWGVNYSLSSVIERATLPANITFTNPTSGSSSTIIFSTVTGFPNVSTTIIISLTNNPSVSSTIIVNTNGEIRF